MGEALMRSIADHDRDPDAVTQTDPALLQEIDDLRAQVGELQERADFTERLLARVQEERTLQSGGGK
jgi:peptidoglycan hydrolase CwlO-like protein